MLNRLHSELAKTTDVTISLTILQQTVYVKRRNWSPMETSKAQCFTKRSDWGWFRALSDNRIRLLGRTRCLQFHSPTFPQDHIQRLPTITLKQPLMRWKKQLLDSLTSPPSSYPPIIECRYRPEESGRENKKIQLQKITSLCLNNGINHLRWIEDKEEKN